MKTLIINGSPRRQGDTAAMIGAAAPSARRVRVPDGMALLRRYPDCDVKGCKLKKAKNMIGHRIALSCSLDAEARGT